MILCIRSYQIFLSPLKVRYHCIYTPTCSQYAIEALEKYGVVKGVIRGAGAVMIQFRNDEEVVHWIY